MANEVTNSRGTDTARSCDKMDNVSIYSSDIKPSDLTLPTSLLDSVPGHGCVNKDTVNGEILGSPTVGETLQIKHSRHNLT